MERKSTDRTLGEVSFLCHFDIIFNGRINVILMSFRCRFSVIFDVERKSTDKTLGEVSFLCHFDVISMSVSDFGNCLVPTKLASSRKAARKPSGPRLHAPGITPEALRRRNGDCSSGSTSAAEKAISLPISTTT